MKIKLNNSIFMVGLVLAVSLIYAKRPINSEPSGTSLMKGLGANGPSQSAIDINNVVYWMKKSSAGTTSGSPNGTQADYPKGTGGLIYEDGMLFGAKVTDGNAQSPRVGGTTYQAGLKAGRVVYNISGDVIGSTDPADHHVWRVRTDWATAAGISDEDKAQYEYDWTNWPASWGAPYKDNDGIEGYDPLTDVPGYPGADQTLWVVANDVPLIVNASGDSTGFSNTAPNAYGADPIGVELQVTMWAYNYGAGDPLGNVVFKKAKMKYTGLPTGYNDFDPAIAKLDTVYFTQWSDPDLGTYTDDYVGCDVDASFGFVYNGNTLDGVFNGIYQLPVPAGGYDFFQGPENTLGIVYPPTSLEGTVPDRLPMTSFTYFGAGSSISDPDLSSYLGTGQFFNLMEGYLPRPEYPVQIPWTDLSTGLETKFVLSGDPVTGTGWVDGVQLPPGDRRLVMASGPFEMNLGDDQTVVLALVGGMGTDNISSVTVAKFHDTFAQYAFDNAFVLPSPPASPVVQAGSFDGKIGLNWGSNSTAIAATEDSVNLGFEFEGYNVYQIASETSPLSTGEKIATYDKINLVQAIFDDGVDPASGYIVQQAKQSGSNSGIQRYYDTDYDELRNRPMTNGITYYFAVTSYSYLPDNAGSPFKTLESSPAIIAVTPQSDNPGTSSGESSVSVAHTGTSTGSVTVTVVDPSRLQGGDYSVYYKYYDPVAGTQKDTLAAADTTADGKAWPIGWNLSEGSTVLETNETPYSTEAAFTGDAPILLESFQLLVQDPPATDFSSWDYDGSRWISGVDWGGRGLFGGLDIGGNFFGSSLPNSALVNVQLVFQDEAGVAAGYASQGAFYRRDQGYGFAGIGDIPFAAYDMTDPANPRQLNISIVENDFGDGSNTANMIFDMGWNGAEFYDLGGREYIFIHNSDYNGGVDYGDDNWAPDSDVLYAIWPQARGSHTYLEAVFTLDIFCSKSAIPGVDSWSFTIEGAQTGLAVSQADIDMISVYPNPYYGFHELEESRSDKYISFNNLPEKATIRIFTMGGTMVREIKKDDSGQFIQWDLANQYGYPVASGLYIIHVDTDHGEKILKLALVQETQVLKYY
jgi:hypothetical protein|tara:strand:- start:1449 stop:4712 length:3264 start_codon:yes stop_codon:yes gene_type:complete